MISSRNNATFDNQALSTIRTDLKEMIEKEKLFGKEVFEVWINEEEVAQNFDETIWSKCLKEARQADIVIAIYNGEAGWLRPSDTIGICHAELLEALNAGRGKVWAIELADIESKIYNDNEKKANEKFQKFMKDQELFSDSVKKVSTLQKSIKGILKDAVIQLVQKGVREVSRDEGNHGETLVWKRMNYDQRSEAIVRTLEDSIDKQGTGYEKDGEFYLEFNKFQMIVKLHAIPDSVSISSARERVGQPFLEDFKSPIALVDDKNIIGPIHIIGCHKTVTETQVRNILGFSDATILKDSFGIYVADNIQKIQMIFLEKCSDSHGVSLRFQSLIEWLERTGELEELIKRAISRKNIIHTIANENK